MAALHSSPADSLPGSAYARNAKHDERQDSLGLPVVADFGLADRRWATGRQQ